jgi:crotonobetaine/carnitine-CoA ligase
MLKIGSENVAALEIESVISAVRGVAEVAVVGGRHSMLDEVPVAFIVADHAVDGGSPAVLRAAVMEACRSRLADFKVPHAVVVVDELPRSTLEKVAKHALREQADHAVFLAGLERP